MSAEAFEVLLRRARAGDDAAAAEIVRVYGPALQRVIRVRMTDRRLRRVHGESDVFQSVMGSFFVRLSLGQFELRGPDDVARLLAVMARNKVAERARRRDVGRDAAQADSDEGVAVAEGGPSPSRVVAARELVAQARARLPDELVEVVALRDEGLAWSEIARRTGGRPEALRKRLERAVGAIAVALGLEESGT